MTKIAIGPTQINTVHLGANTASAVYLGAQQIWSTAPPPAWASTAASGPATGTSIVATVPAGVATGDIIMCFLVALSATALVVTPPDGTWTQKGSAVVSTTSLGSVQSTCWWHRATGPDTGTYTFTVNSSQSLVADIMRYTGAIASGDPVDAYTNAASSALGSTSPALNLTTLGANRLLVWFAAAPTATAGNLTAPTGYSHSEWAGSRSKVNDTTQATAGSTGTVAGTTTTPGGDAFTSWLIALKAA